MLIPLGPLGSMVTTQIANATITKLESYSLPGDPDALRENVIERLKNPFLVDLDDAAEYVSRLHSTMVTDPFLIGDGGEELTEQSEKIKTAFTCISAGISTVVTALTTWADQMEDCQRRCETAKSAAIDAAKQFVTWDGKRATALNIQTKWEKDLATARKAADDAAQAAREAAEESGEPVSIPEFVDTFSGNISRAIADREEAEREKGKAEGSLQSYYQQILTAQEKYQTYAAECVAAIRAVLNDQKFVHSVDALLQIEDMWKALLSASEAVTAILTALFNGLGGGLLGSTIFKMFSSGTSSGSSGSGQDSSTSASYANVFPDALRKTLSNAVNTVKEWTRELRQ